MIVVCGEALVDLVPLADASGLLARPGGSPANVAVGLGRLGVPTRLLARLSTDHFGQMIRRHLTASGVDLGLAIDAPQRSTVAMVSLDAGGSPSYLFSVDGCADGAWRPDELPASLPEAAPLHVSGSFALGVPGMRSTMRTLLEREHGRRVISFDPNPRPGLTPDLVAARATLEAWVGLADIVKVSEEDLGWMLPGEPHPAVARRWRDLGPALVVVTRGADGVHALGPGGVCELPAPPVAVVDTVGAGDAFTAGLLAALDRTGHLTPAGIRGLDRPALTDALHRAQRVAGATCARRGADPPWRHELGD